MYGNCKVWYGGLWPMLSRPTAYFDRPWIHTIGLLKLSNCDMWFFAFLSRTSFQLCLKKVCSMNKICKRSRNWNHLLIKSMILNKICWCKTKKCRRKLVGPTWLLVKDLYLILYFIQLTKTLALVHVLILIIFT